MLEELKKRIDLLDGIHCVIGDRYCSYKDDGYIDEFYINAVSNEDIEIYYNKVTYKYSSFEEMINDKLFNNKSIIDLAGKIFFEK